MSNVKIKYGNQHQIVKSFYDWCTENNKQIYLDCWDYELNQKSPKEVGYKSNKKYWFRCPRNLHNSFQRYLTTLVNGKDAYFCIGCSSIGQFIIDTYGDNYLYNVWSDKNELNPFEIFAGSTKKIWFKCLNNKNHPDYNQEPSVFKKGMKVWRLI